LLVIGHRGASGSFEENTIESIQQAVLLGADGVEFDVRFHQSGVVALHDETVDRTTTGTGKLASLSLTQLRAIETYNGESLPYLEDLLRAARFSKLINVEMKESTIGPAVARAVENFRATHSYDLSRFLLSSFERPALRAIRDLGLGYRLGVLHRGHFTETLQQALELRAFSIHLAFKDVRQDQVSLAQSHGLKVFCYTINSKARAKCCRKLGIDGIFSDFPDKVANSNRGNPR
jgi:glycerophosphoryl diester phosphodiesterase